MTTPLSARAARLFAWPPIFATLPRWAVFLIAALLARAITFGNPVVHVDEEFYFTTALRMLHGAIPYVDVWDRKPIGLFLIYLPAAAFGVPLGIWVYQAMATASVVLTALLLAKLADRAGWGAGATVAALFYVLGLDFADGQGGQAPVFYDLVMVAAVCLIVPRVGDVAGDWRRKGRAVLALLLVGVALQIKYSVLLEGMFLGLWLLFREWRLGASVARILPYGAVLILAALVPTALAWGVYAALGHGDAFLYANFQSILQRQSDPADVLLRGFLKIALVLAPLLVMSGFSRNVPQGEPIEDPVRGLLFGWLIAAVLSVIAFGGWFNHYALPVMAPGACCSAGFLGSYLWGRRLAVPMLAALLIGGQVVMVNTIYHRGDGRELRALAGAIGQGPGCLYVYSGNSILYSYTGRCAVTAWTFPSHLSRERESAALGVDQLQEIERVFARRPQFVVMRPTYFGERAAAHALALAKLKAGGYVLRGRYPLGDILIDVFEAPEPPRLAATSPA